MISNVKEKNPQNTVATLNGKRQRRRNPKKFTLYLNFKLFHIKIRLMTISYFFYK